MKDSLMLSLLLTVTALTDHYYLIYSYAALLLGFFFFLAFSQNRSSRFSRYVIISVVLATILTSPLMIATLLGSLRRVRV